MTEQEEKVVKRALNIVKKEVRTGSVLTSPKAARDFLVLLLAGREREVFVVIYLDAQHRVIDHEEMFQGTLTQTSVYPREVVKGALKHNASSLLVCHNHPSGCAQQSLADEWITQQLKNSLAVVDVKLLDHLIVAGENVVSLAERGLI